jgi:hypothetical protein
MGGTFMGSLRKNLLKIDRFLWKHDINSAKYGNSGRMVGNWMLDAS